MPMTDSILQIDCFLHKLILLFTKGTFRLFKQWK